MTTLASNLTGEEIKGRLANFKWVEEDNASDPNFNPVNDPKIQEISCGVTPEHVFEIENTVPGTDLYVKNHSVIKVMNS